MDNFKVIKRNGQNEIRIIGSLPYTPTVHQTYEVGSTGNIYDSHITSNLPGNKKLRASP
jgi:hypothetical protein